MPGSQGSGRGIGPAQTPPDATRATRWKIIGSIAALLIAAVILGWQLFSGPPSAETLTRRRDLIDSQTLEVFKDFRVADDSRAPWLNPQTGATTLYPAEKCFWTKEGKAKIDPTYVLLNLYVGKTGDTICPDCGRRVVAHNPPPPIGLLNDAMGIKEGDAGGTSGSGAGQAGTGQAGTGK
jgi:hypothetical protein